MTQNEFFNILMDGLKHLPEKKLKDIIIFYDNKFTTGLADGKTEEEIIEELGNPNLIVNKYENGTFQGPITSENTVTNSDDIDNKNSINDIPITKGDNINASRNENDFNSKQNFSTDNLRTNLKESRKSNDYNNNNNFNYNQNSNTFNDNFTAKNSSNKTSMSNTNTILKICIAILSLMIFFPVITGIIGCIIGLFGAAIGIFAASIGVLIGGTFTSFMGLPNLPSFVANFPYQVIVLFSLGSISLSILLLLLFYYLCKFIIRMIIKLYSVLKVKGGTF